jgi:hypothetical protein
MCYPLIMRGSLLFAWLFAGCGSPGAPSAAPSYGLMLRFGLGPALPALPDLSLSTLKLHLTQLAAVSDRGSSDPRAATDSVDVAFGETVQAELATAPAGTYSSLQWTLGDASIAGVDLQGTAAGQRMHVELVGGPFDARCQSPRELAPGQRVRLTLTVDPTGWFDGVDLSTAMNDEDDNGIIINMEDNSALAFEILDNAIKSFQLECEPW